MLNILGIGGNFQRILNTKMTYKGEKYIYLLMAYKLAQLNNGSVTIGKDSGYSGGQNYERRFKIEEYKDKILLVEIKTSKAFTDYSRVFEIIIGNSQENELRPIIADYINEYGENAGKNWVH